MRTWLFLLRIWLFLLKTWLYLLMNWLYLLRKLIGRCTLQIVYRNWFSRLNADNVLICWIWRLLNLSLCSHRQWFLICNVLYCWCSQWCLMCDVLWCGLWMTKLKQIKFDIYELILLPVEYCLFMFWFVVYDFILSFFLLFLLIWGLLCCLLIVTLLLFNLVLVL